MENEVSEKTKQLIAKAREELFAANHNLESAKLAFERTKSDAAKENLKRAKEDVKEAKDVLKAIIKPFQRELYEKEKSALNNTRELRGGFDTPKFRSQVSGKAIGIVPRDDA
tara:strand:+ start:1146 stop:1481 length:336 start_codon:yes stop_codon:yes gene_type:complete